MHVLPCSGSTDFNSQEMETIRLHIQTQKYRYRCVHVIIQPLKRKLFKKEKRKSSQL